MSPQGDQIVFLRISFPWAEILCASTRLLKDFYQLPTTSVEERVSAVLDRALLVTSTRPTFLACFQFGILNTHFVD